ncbi:MAG: Putative oxidoreductase, partial [uncultured Thermomicrobiales bacterium]
DHGSPTGRRRHRGRQRDRGGGRPCARRGWLDGRAGGAPQGRARRDRGGRRGAGRSAGRDPGRRHQRGQRPWAVRRDGRALWPGRPAVQQRRDRRARRRDRRDGPRDLEPGRRREPDRRLPLHAGGVPGHARAATPGRPDHQQRLHLGPCAPATLDRLHRHQARDHRPDEVDRARRATVRHRLRADRHRQRGDRHGARRGVRRRAARRRRP